MGQIHAQQGQWPQARQLFEQASTLNEQDWEAWNGLGLVQFHQGQYGEAKGSYLKCLQINDRCAEAYNNLGNLFAKVGDAAAAERAYRDAAQRSPKDADILFNLGEFLFNQRHPDTERTLRRVVELNPADYDAWELLRRWYPQQPDYPAWRKALDTLLALRPKDAELLRELAGVAEHQNDMPTTLDALRRVIELDPADQDAHLFITRIHLKQDLVQEAFKHISLVERTDNETLALWKHIGQRLLHRGHAEAAETCFLAVVAHHALEVDLWQVLGEMAYARGDWEVAFERFVHAEPVTRNNWELWKSLADRFVTLNQPTRATQCLEYLDDLWPHLPEQWRYGLGVWRAAGRARAFLERLEAQLDQADATARLWLEMARLWEEEGVADRARACAARVQDRSAPLPPVQPAPEQAQPERPGPPAAATAEEQLRLARDLLERGDAAGALEQLQRLGGAERQDLEYWMLLGEATYSLGRLSDARAAFQKAVALDAKLFRAWFKLGNVLFRERRLSEAEQAFAKGSLLEPKEPKVWYNLGVAQAEQKRLELARDSFRRALALHRRFSQAWNWLGIVHVNRAETKLARRCFLRCIAVQRRSANGWFNLGMLYQSSGRKEEAARCLAEADRLGGAIAGEGVVPVKLFHTRDPRQTGDHEGV
jgi:tetratricopeptide (TPR) repeat protein